MLPLQRVLQWLWQYSRYKAGTLAMLNGVENCGARFTLNEETCAAAAAQGRLDVIKFLRHQKPPCPWSSETCTAAAYRGKLDVLLWLFGQTPPCPFNIAAIDCLVKVYSPQVLQSLLDALPASNRARKKYFMNLVVIRAAVNKQAEVFKWAAASQPHVVVDVVRMSSQLRPERRGMIQWLQESGCLCVGQPEHKRLQSAPSIPAAMGDLVALQRIEAVLAAHDAFYQAALAANAGRLSISAHREIWQNDIHINATGTPVANPDHVAVAEWLMDHLSDSQKAQLRDELWQTEGSLLALEMKAHRPERYEPKITWTAANLSFAAAHVRLPALRWLLEQQDLAPEYMVVHKECSNGRLLLLVHGHGWRLPAQLQCLLDAAERRRATYYAIVKQHQSKASSAACLGNLPPDIIKAIACRADFDFSWSRS